MRPFNTHVRMQADKYEAEDYNAMLARKLEENSPQTWRIWCLHIASHDIKESIKNYAYAKVTGPLGALASKDFSDWDVPTPLVG